ncbi:NHL repeat-containing protein [Granulicella cerasi]|nr:hypothetical protein [Granulicella cerasi]
MSTAHLGTDTSTSSIGAVKGTMYGGQNPVSGAAVYLLEANATAYAGPGITASTANASKSLLTAASNTTADSNGRYYVTTDAGGGFSLTGDYTCDANQVVYLYTLGGNSGAAVNPAIGMMSVLGVCPASGGTLAAVTPYVWVNEVTTVAAAYALSGFATDATHIGYSGSAAGLVGLQNAAANFKNLVNVGTGVVNQTTPGSVTGIGNIGTVPYQKINTLANILVACVNTASSNSSACSTLFSNAQSAGSSGTIPTDTATAAINIAHNPGSNTSALYGLQTGVGTAFLPHLTAAPNDFALPVSYTGGGLNGGFMTVVDATGNVWVSNYFGNSLSKFSPQGVVASPGGFTGGGLNEPTGMAIDSLGNIWVKNAGANVISEFTSMGSVVSANGYAPSGYVAGTLSAGLAFDTSGRLWITSASSSNASGYLMALTNGVRTLGPFTDDASADSASASGLYGGNWVSISNATIWTANSNTTVSAFLPSGQPNFGGPLSVANMTSTAWVDFDASGFAWVVDFNSSAIARINQAAGNTTAYDPSTGGLSYPSGLQVDANGSVWVSNNGTPSLSQLRFSSPVIVPVSPSTGYRDPNSDANAEGAVQLDASGNAWTVDDTNHLIQWVGIATPQATPVSPTRHATRP